jgi:hypothetical protein
MMNKSKEIGFDKKLRDVLVLSDMYTDLQSFVLSPPVAYEIGKEISAPIRKVILQDLGCGQEGFRTHRKSPRERGDNL